MIASYVFNLLTYSVTAASTDPSGYNTELKSKESSGIDTESKSFGNEASVVETENEKPPIEGS